MHIDKLKFEYTLLNALRQSTLEDRLKSIGESGDPDMVVWKEGILESLKELKDNLKSLEQGITL